MGKIVLKEAYKITLATGNMHKVQEINLIAKQYNIQSVLPEGEFYPIEDGSDNTVAIVYTGGTTGDPKGVELTNNNLNYSAHNFLYSEMDFYPGLKSMNILPPSIGYYFNATYNLLCCGVSVNFISQFKVQEYPKLIK